MAEPFTILSAIGTSISIINLVIRTALELRTVSLVFREAEERFEFFHLRLTTCETATTEWTSRWGMPEYSRVTAWGSEGLAVINRYTQQIQKIDERIRDILLLKSDTILRKLKVTETELKAWNSAANSKGRSFSAAIPVDFKKRCLLVLFQESELGEKISRLECLISGLGLESCLRWSIRHSGEKKDPSRVERDRVLKLNHIRDFMSRWYEICVTEDNENWALELRLPYPSDIDIWELVEESTVNFALIDRNTWAKGDQYIIFARIRICLHKAKESSIPPLSLSEAALHTLFEEAKARLRNEEYPERPLIEFADSLIEIDWLELPRRNMVEMHRWRVKDELLETNRLSEIERTYLAYSAAIWILMLSTTPWLSRLCSCGIHSLNISQENPCNIHLTWREKCSCGRVQGSENRMLLYGILLCELGLGKPVAINSTDKSSHFIIAGRALTESELLQELGTATESSRYKNAVQFCLTQVSSSKVGSPDVQTIEEYKKGVIEPIRELHKAYRRREQRRRQRGRAKMATERMGSDGSS